MKKLSDENIQFIVNNLEARLKKIERYLKSFDMFSFDDNPDILLEEAEKLAKQHDMISASLFQRKLEIGYARAARLLDQLEERGIVGSGEGSKPRKVLKK